MKGIRKRGIASFVAACGLAAVLGLAACSPQNAEETPASPDVAGTASEAAFAWSYDSDCSMCHATETSSMEDAACLASTHAAQGNTCQTCHSDEAGLSEAHVDATAELAAKRATKLRSTTIEEKACLACHGSYEELAEKTAASTVLTDAEGKVVNPHAIPENEDHAATDCSSCHAMHSSEPASETAPDYCISCHHANVFACHTCHD